MRATDKDESKVLSREGSIGIDNRIYVKKDSYDCRYTHEHFHDFLEIVYIVSGNAVHLINGREYRTHTGDLYLLDFSDKHHFIDKDGEFTIITCAFTPDAVDESLVESHNAKDVLEFLLFNQLADSDGIIGLCMNILGDGEEVIELLEQMNVEYTEQKPGYKAVLKGELLVLLSKLFRLAIEKNAQKTELYQREIVNKTIEYLNQNCYKPLSVEMLAQKALLSPSYFSSIFKSCTGVGITTYIQRLRIKRACYLLTTISKTVDEVMTEVGYSDSKFFYKIFRQYTSLTPGAYKKKHRKTPYLSE